MEAQAMPPIPNPTALSDLGGVFPVWPRLPLVVKVLGVVSNLDTGAGHSAFLSRPQRRRGGADWRGQLRPPGQCPADAANSGASHPDRALFSGLWTAPGRRCGRTGSLCRFLPLPL